MQAEPHDPDRDLAAAARRGDREALAALYERHKKRLFGFLRRAAGDRAMAEDVFQETWMKVLQMIERYDPARAPFRSWLFSVASNAAVDRLRRETVRRGVPLDDRPAGENGTVAGRLISPEPGPDRRGAADEARRALTTALAALPERQRVAVLLRHQQGLTDAELSAALGVSEGAARGLVHRGVAAVRVALGGRYDA